MVEGRREGAREGGREGDERGKSSMQILCFLLKEMSAQSGETRAGLLGQIESGFATGSSAWHRWTQSLGLAGRHSSGLPSSLHEQPQLNREATSLLQLHGTSGNNKLETEAHPNPISTGALGLGDLPAST